MKIKVKRKFTNNFFIDKSGMHHTGNYFYYSKCNTYEWFINKRIDLLFIFMYFKRDDDIRIGKNKIYFISG